MFTINFGELELDLDKSVDDAFEEYEEDEMIVPAAGCSIGDHVSCKFRNKLLIARHERGEGHVVLTIAGKVQIEDAIEYVAYIPPESISCIVDSSFTIRPQLAVEYGIHRKYVGEQGITLRKNNIWRVVFHADGMACKRCEEFFPKAESNQEDGTLVCYQCRQNPWR